MKLPIVPIPPAGARSGTDTGDPLAIDPVTPDASVHRGDDLRDDLRQDDLFELLTAFYATIEGNPLLAPYFIDLDMQAHMPRIVAFWETIVFQAGTYTGNAFKPHLTMPGLGASHFAQWVKTMEQTVNARAAGPNAERMKDMAHRIAYSMQLRLGITPFAEWNAGA